MKWVKYPTGEVSGVSYDISLKDPITHKTIEIKEPHFMRGGTYQLGGSTELWLNITYNYANYYYDATDGDPRFAHKEERNGEFEEEYGIRGIYGKTGLESIPMLEDMISRIEYAYGKDGGWITTRREKWRCLDLNGDEIKDPIYAILHGIPHTDEKIEVDVWEGPNDDYWEATAANAIRPLHQLIAMAKMRPDGIWDGD